MNEIARGTVRFNKFLKIVIAAHRPTTPNPPHIVGFDPVFAVRLDNMRLIIFLLCVISIYSFAGLRATKKLKVEFLFQDFQRRAPILTMSNRCLDVEDLLRAQVVRQQINLPVVANHDLDVRRGEAAAAYPKI